MNANFCPSCGRSNRAGANFCTDCGHSFTGAMPSAPPTSVMSSRSHELQPGQVMNGQYTIERQLGKGGMGAVYLAQETIANQPRYVVIKEMLIYYDPSDPQAEVKARQRFEAEAANLAKLNFASIPQIYVYFSEAGRNYIVMQYIRGRDLEKGVTHTDDHGHSVLGQAYPVEKVLRWGIQVCQVLENLAKQNIVHLDIKPANLIEDNSGNVWLVDFGTAKAERSKQAGGQVGLQKSSVYGTIGYAPPEQYNGQAEPRSDVYALAATLYHLLTDNDPRNNPPFSFPKLSKVPSEIRSVLKQALEGDVQKRITAKKFRQLLERLTTTEILFYWQDGTVSRQPQDLVPQSNQHWEEAKIYFRYGKWEKWFNDLHRNDVLAQLKQSKRRYKDYDIALDAFLRLLDPAFPLPSLQMNLSSLDFGDVAWKEQPMQNLELRNAGSGCLHVKISCASNWVQINPVGFVYHKYIDTYSLNTIPVELVFHEQTTIKVTVNTNRLTPRAQPYTANLLIDIGNCGQEQVPITISVPLPRLKINRTHLNLGSGYHEQTLTDTLTVRNEGGSLFDCKVQSDKTWISVQPPRFRCQPADSKKVRVQVLVNANQLAPRVSPYTANLVIDASLAGKQQVAVSLTVPEPNLHINPHNLDLGLSYQGTTRTDFFTISNLGGHPFEGEIHCDTEWVTIQPSRFRGQPRKSTQIQVKLNTSKITIGQNHTRIRVHTQVGKWKKAEDVTVMLHLPFWKLLGFRFLRLITYLLGWLGKLLEWVAQLFKKLLVRYPIQAIILSVIVIIASIPISYAYDWYIKSEECYNNAEALEQTQEYAQAATAFEQCGWYGGATDRALEMHYQAGQASLEAEQWEDAIAEFEKVGEYKDASYQLLQTHRQAYHAYLAIGENKAAEREFQWLNQWHVVRTLKGHTGLVLSVAFSHDGALLASASSDETIRLWHMKDGTPLQTLVGYTDTVSSLAFSPNETLLASGSADKKVLLWDVESGEVRHSFEGHTAGVSSVAFSPDGSMLASGSSDNTVQLWDVANHKAINSWQAHRNNVLSVIFSPDGRLLASGSTNDLIRLWRVPDGELVHRLKGHAYQAKNSLAFSPDGKWLASGSDDYTVRLWRVADGELMHTLKDRARWVNSVAFSPDGTLLASGSLDETVQLWRLADGELVQTLEGHTGGVRSVAFSPNGMMLASGSDDGTVRLWGLGIDDE